MRETLVAVVDRSNGKVFRRDDNILDLAGKKPRAPFVTAALVFMLVMLILAFASGQVDASYSKEIHTFWTLSIFPLVLGMVLSLGAVWLFGLFRCRAYRKHLASIRQIVDEAVTESE